MNTVVASVTFKQIENLQSIKTSFFDRHAWTRSFNIKKGTHVPYKMIIHTLNEINRKESLVTFKQLKGLVERQFSDNRFITTMLALGCLGNFIHAGYSFYQARQIIVPSGPDYSKITNEQRFQHFLANRGREETSEEKLKRDREVSIKFAKESYERGAEGSLKIGAVCLLVTAYAAYRTFYGKLGVLHSLMQQANDPKSCRDLAARVIPELNYTVLTLLARQCFSSSSTKDSYVYYKDIFLQWFIPYRKV